MEIDLTKQFYLFSFSEFYPSGGLSDIVGAYDSIQEGIAATTDSKIFISNDSCYIFDKLLGKIVYNANDYLK